MVKIGYVYKLCINDGTLDDCYVGSTGCIKQRKCRHKHACENPSQPAHHFRVYQFIRENKGFDNWNIHVLEKVEYNEKIELLQRERHYIETLKPSLNCAIPMRTTEEKKEKKTIKDEKYRARHRDEIRERNNKFEQEHKEERRKHWAEYRNQLIKCPECEKEIKRSSLYRHTKTFHP